jgi:hypothetical protein
LLLLYTKPKIIGFRTCILWFLREEYATAAIQKIQKYETHLRQGYGVARHGTGYWTATDNYILAETDKGMDCYG